MLIDYSSVLQIDIMVRWLVDNGTRVDRGKEIYGIIPMQSPLPLSLLETATVYASVTTFKLLKKRFQNYADTLLFSQARRRN
jgi:hypothetical protein